MIHGLLVTPTSQRSLAAISVRGGWPYYLICGAAVVAVVLGALFL